jgi:hypothetical protein
MKKPWSELKLCAYGSSRPGLRSDPTRAGVKKAEAEGRFSAKRMGQAILDEIAAVTEDASERHRLLREYHNERVVELVRTKEVWLDKPDTYPIKVNQFNEVFEGNHRIRAIRYLGLDDVEVTVVEEAEPRGFNNIPDIWE